MARNRLSFLFSQDGSGRTMPTVCRLFVALLSAAIVSGGLIAAAPPQDLPEMQFNDVKEIAPGVFFRYSAKSATDPTIFGGCNNIWVVFADYVLAFDANFPKEANDVITAIRKTTDKPIRFVVNSHQHKDHCFGNAVFAEAGATVIAQENCARVLRVLGPKQFEDAGKGVAGRADIAKSRLRAPDLLFNDKLVFLDKHQHAELLYFGRAHTMGDTFLYLPKHKILCTADTCVNGAFSYLADADSAGWIRVLEKAEQLDVKIVCPGHGPLGGKSLLGLQRRYLAELRTHVKKGIDAGEAFEDILKKVKMPWYKEWTGVEASTHVAATRHVFDELTGRLPPPHLPESEPGTASVP
jgi:cyclase